jgi:hypothetical protein
LKPFLDAGHGPGGPGRAAGPGPGCRWPTVVGSLGPWGCKSARYEVRRDFKGRIYLKNTQADRDTSWARRPSSESVTESRIRGGRWAAAAPAARAQSESSVNRDSNSVGEAEVRSDLHERPECRASCGRWPGLSRLGAAQAGTAARAGPTWNQVGITGRLPSHCQCLSGTELNLSQTRTRGLVTVTTVAACQ